jgi:hypothetical protein
MQNWLKSMVMKAKELDPSRPVEFKRELNG